jgi:hypothetical protein
MARERTGDTFCAISSDLSASAQTALLRRIPEKVNE